jgi:hypothetical protein
MPFQWYHYDVPKWYKETFPEKRLAMYLDDMRVKATLLRNLRYDKEYVKLRLRGNVRWAHEMTGTPDLVEKVEQVVEEVFARHVPATR